MSADALLSRLAMTRIGVWTIKCLVSPIQRWIYHRMDGKIVSKIGSGRYVLLLTTQGRRTGKARTIPIFYLRDGERLIICNVSPRIERVNPWIINLCAHSTAQIQIGKNSEIYHAQEASEANIERYWPSFVSLWQAYQFHYDHGGQRTIFILENSQK